jgi:biopolymer transport protein ExbD
MKIRRNSNLLVESPASATGDIAFNLIVFFLVCVSVQPSTGRQQTIPKAETVEQKKQGENIEVLLTRNVVMMNGNPVTDGEFDSLIQRQLKGKKRPEDRIVVVKSKPDVEFKNWIDITSRIEDAGGIITLQVEEEREVMLPE